MQIRLFFKAYLNIFYIVYFHTQQIVSIYFKLQFYVETRLNVILYTLTINVIFIYIFRYVYSNPKHIKCCCSNDH